MSRELFRAGKTPSSVICVRRPRHRDHRRVRRLLRRFAAHRWRRRRPSRRSPYPEMRRFNYPQSFSTGVIAAGGTLGIMIPPSTVLAVYGSDHRAGCWQAVCCRRAARYSRGLHVHARQSLSSAMPGPAFSPSGKKATWSGAARRLKDVWATLLSFRVRDRRHLRRHVHRNRSGWAWVPVARS